MTLDRSTQRKRPATIIDVAERAGVAIGTVSRYLNGHPIRRGNRDQIEEAIGALGYRRNAVAAAMKTDLTKVVGFLVPSLSEFHSQVLEHLRAVMRRSGRAVLTYCHNDDRESVVTADRFPRATRRITGEYGKMLAALAAEVTSTTCTDPSAGTCCSSQAASCCPNAVPVTIRKRSSPRRVTVNGVDLRLAPVSEGCLSSGFGPRGGKRHGGVDYFARRGDVLAAGDGVIKEVESRADFGNMILIDHGRGVYTRYAHLASFDRAFAAGQKVKDGQRLGPIGATGAAGAPHLHYEILSGSFVSGAGSFGLNQHDPFALPGAK